MHETNLFKLQCSWREMPYIHVNCALCDKFLQFGLMLGMGIRFSKTTANKVGWQLVTGLHNIKNGRFSNSEIYISTCFSCNTTFYVFSGVKIPFLKYFLYLEVIYMVKIFFQCYL